MLKGVLIVLQGKIVMSKDKILRPLVIIHTLKDKKLKLGGLVHMLKELIQLLVVIIHMLKAIQAKHQL